jgi:kumamolisin
VAALAPQANILMYQASTDNTSFAQAMVDLLNRVGTDHSVQVLSISYGAAESSFSSSEMDAVNRSLRTLAAEGISVFISSGDCGAYTLRIRQPQVAEVAFPASAPYAIAVGGTHLQVNNNNVRTSETVWGDDDGSLICQNQWGSGGGVSQDTAFKRPSWQIGKGTTTQYDGTSKAVFTATLPPEPVKAPNGLRQVPDVAAAAYPNIAIYYNGTWYASGGTSAAAPIWAAGATLINQAMQKNGKSSLGGVPEFYTLANNPKNFHPYTDITVGNNLFYSATPGWDYTTGWGSPNFSDIAQMELS